MAEPHREHDTVLLAEVRLLRAEVTALRRSIEHQPARKRAQQFLAAIAGHAGTRAFSASELVRHAALRDSDELRNAIVARCGALVARKVGRALRGIEGQQLGGLMVCRVGADRDGLLWLVRACEFDEANSYA